MKNPIQNNNSKFSKRSKEKAIAPHDMDTEIDKPDKQPVLIIKDPSAVKDPSTSKTPISDQSRPEDAKQPLSEDKGSSLSKLRGDRKPVMSDGEKTKDSDSGDGLYGSKQPTTGDKQESTGAIGAQLGGASGAGILLGGQPVMPIGLLGASGGLPLGFAGAQRGALGASGGLPLGFAGAQSGALGASPGGTSAAVSGAQRGLTSGATPANVGAGLASLQATGAAAYAAANSVSEMGDPLYTQAESSNDVLIGSGSTGTLDSLTNYGLSDPSLGQTTLTLELGGDGVLTNFNPPLNPPSSFTYVPNLDESTGAIAPSGIGSSGGTILLPNGLSGSILTISGLDSGGFSLPVK